jgi:hypothetical protein
MAYTKTIWNEGASPGISGAKLNNIEQGIYEAHERISNLALTPGGTTGDAELADIRVGADGKSYDNAGDAVRTQVATLGAKIDEVSGQLSSEIEDLSVNLKTMRFDAEYVERYEMVQGAIDLEGTPNSLTNRVRSKKAIFLPIGTKIKALNSNYMFNVTYYSSETMSKSYCLGTPNTWMGEYTTDKECYVALVIKKADNTDFTPNSIVLNEILTIGESEYIQIQKENISDSVMNELRSTNNFCHLSFDDVTTCVNNLQTNESVYNSIFDEPFLAKLKELHDKYGSVFSLYCYDEIAWDNLTNKFFDEFSKNSNWLKIGFHLGRNTSVENGLSQEDYNNFVGNLCRVCGINTLDRLPRLNGFQGTLSNIQGLRNANGGIIGLLSTDDSRNPYYMSEAQKNHLSTKGKLIDLQNGLVIFPTIMRLDWFVGGFSSDYEYQTPIKSTPYEELKYRYGMSENANRYRDLVIFVHEWQVYSANGINNNFSLVESACKFANDYGYAFDFPMNRTEDFTSLVLG